MNCIQFAWTAILLAACAPAAKVPTSIDVRQLRVVDEKGTPQFVLTSDTALADRPGTTRKVHGPALLLNDAVGHEVGGMGMHEKSNAFCFDYPLKPGQTRGASEAICLVEEDGRFAGIYVNDPKASTNTGDVGSERLAFTVENGESKVQLSDKNGNPRIRLRVAANGDSQLEFLDATGNTVYSLPPTGTR